MQDRIQLIMKVKNLTPSQFADALEIQRSTLSHIITGRNKPSLDIVIKILGSYPEIEPMWLLTGSGQMNKQDTKTKPQQLTLEIPVEATPPPPAEKKNKPEIAPEWTVNQFTEGKKEVIIPAENAMEVQKIILLYPDGSFESYKQR